MKQVLLTFGLYQEVPNINAFSHRIFKLKFKLEKYLCSLSLFNRKILCRFRTSIQLKDYQLKGEDTMASIEETEHVSSVILIKFVMNSSLYSNVIPLLIYGKLSYCPTVKIIRTIKKLKISCQTHSVTFLMN